MFSIVKNGSKVFSQVFEGSHNKVNDQVHAVNGRSLKGPFDISLKKIILGMGCFWGVEKLFWNVPGVHITAVGYSGGVTENPNYKQVCTGQTGHNEVVLIYYDPKILSLVSLLKLFWEGHDPTQGMRQGNDIGTQYRSAIFYTNQKQKKLIEKYIKRLAKSIFINKDIVTKVELAKDFYIAEKEHLNYFNLNSNQPYCQLVIIPKIEKLKQIV